MHPSIQASKHPSLGSKRSAAEAIAFSIYLYDHSSSDKEIDGRGPGRGEKANEEAFKNDGSTEHTIRLAD